MSLASLQDAGGSVIMGGNSGGAALIGQVEGTAVAATSEQQQAQPPRLWPNVSVATDMTFDARVHQPRGGWDGGGEDGLGQQASTVAGGGGR